MLQLDNKEKPLLQERLKMYAAIPRKVVAKLHSTIRKENMGYDQYTVPDWLYLSNLLLLRISFGSLKHKSTASPASFSNFFETSELKTTHNTFRNSCVYI